MKAVYCATSISCDTSASQLIQWQMRSLGNCHQGKEAREETPAQVGEPTSEWPGAIASPTTSEIAALAVATPLSSLSPDSHKSDKDSNKDNRSESPIINADFDLFEAGCVWTQGVSTQAQHRAWRRGWQVSSPTQDAAVGPCVPIRANDDQDSVDLAWMDAARSSSPVASTSFPSPSRRQGSQSPLRKSPYHSQGHQVDSTRLLTLGGDANDSENITPGQDGTRDRPLELAATQWWDKGKTAPMLRDFDAERRAWYMEQAGLSEQSSSVHDARARNVDAEPTNNAQLHSQRHDSTPQRVLIMGARNVHSAVPTQAAPTAMQNSPFTRPSAAAVNSPRTPFALARQPSVASAQTSYSTPKRKTWNTTWGSVTSQDRTPAGMAKKSASAATSSRARGRGRGRGGTASHLATPTARGRGRGRGGGTNRASTGSVR